MAVIPSSMSKVSGPGTAFDLVTFNNLTTNTFKSTSNLAFYFQNFPYKSVKLLFEKRRWFSVPTKSRVHALAAEAYEFSNKEPVSAVRHEDSAEKNKFLADVVNSETTRLTANAHVNPNVKPKRSRPSRKSEMPPVKTEELVPGASFIGKVRSIQPFGAFVDIGAFTEGLIHISNLSDGFVTDVKSIVSVGQEVRVCVVKVNVEAEHISLTMRESDASRRNKKSSKFVKGQERRVGSVTNLPEREEGSFLRSKESVEDSVNATGSSLMQVSQEVRPRVSDVAKEQVSEVPPVKTEELVCGASFTGRVRTIKPFGAFVDIGAFTEGLVHISNMSGGFVTDIKNIVAVGQEVRVTVLETNVAKRRISLTMWESSDTNDLQQRNDSSSAEPIKESVEDAVNVMGSSFVQVSQEVRPSVSHVAKEQVSEVPPVKTEELVHGASFTGKIRSIQSFGAFVDIGAFTEGLVHISNMSDGFVTNIKSIVSVGQEVRVTVLETNVVKRRISLTMRESGDTNDLQQRKDSSSAELITAPKNTTRTKKKNSKFVKGQELEGTVKSLNKCGSVISLPEGEEGFLPRSEESVEDIDIVNVTGGSSLQVGQEIKVRVLHVAKGQVTLTMKKEDGAKKHVPELIHIGAVHEATNPFVLAFLKNKDIAKFLVERESLQRLA